MGKKKTYQEAVVTEQSILDDVEVKLPEVESLGKIAKIDINLTYRKGSFVPQERIDLWDSMGINISDFF